MFTYQRKERRRRSRYDKLNERRPLESTEFKMMRGYSDMINCITIDKNPGSIFTSLKIHKSNSNSCRMNDVIINPASINFQTKCAENKRSLERRKRIASQQLGFGDMN
ncbi:unnamed protein product [Camellia sinensis]